MQQRARFIPPRNRLALDPGKPTEVYVTPDNQKLFVALGKGGVDAFPFDAATGAVGTRQHIAPLHEQIRRTMS